MKTNRNASEPAIVLFDGVCNLCDATINFVIDRDPNGRFRFASLQSEVAQQLLQELAFSQRSLDSIVLIESGSYYTQSTAVLRIARHLPGVWPFLYSFIIVPAPIRDYVYSWVARNRYRWFGQSQTCRVPTPELQARFL